jgi:hypothetical protein
VPLYSRGVHVNCEFCFNLERKEANQYFVRNGGRFLSFFFKLMRVSKKLTVQGDVRKGWGLLVLGRCPQKRVVRIEKLHLQVFEVFSNCCAFREKLTVQGDVRKVGRCPQGE